MTRTTKILLLVLCLFGALILLGGVVYENLQSKISTRLERGYVLPPLELYSQGIPLAAGRRFPQELVEAEMEKRGLHAGRDYYLESIEACADMTKLSFSEKAVRCLWVRTPNLVVTWDAEGWIVDLWKGSPLAPASSTGLFPALITQFYDGQPILQQNAPRSEIPLACLQAVIAIEDKDFLKHVGVSATGTFRAFIRNLKARRFAEGGSTITQQLVKNFFLTSKKTLRRKIEEQFLSLLLESQMDKDTILEMYLNVIYMGQSGPYQVRGFGSAAEVVFDKPISQLSLPECALLAATINSPGRYNAFEHPEAAKNRRDLVLRKMAEGGMIADTEAEEAMKMALPKVAPALRRSHAPYFVMSALREFESWEIDSENGARLYTTLDPEAQAGLISAVNKVMPAVEKRVKKPSVQPLQVAAIAVDIKTAEVIALTGGRDYRSTQFNRAIDSRRQVGSIVKPFVFLPALRDSSPVGPVSDDPFEWKTGKQVWKPRNYEGKSYPGNVPLFFALAHSLNIPTARIGQQVGLETVIDALRNAGVTSKIPNLPSLTLGALELSPMEVAQSYLTLARMGSTERLHLLSRAEDINGNVLFEYQPSADEALDPVNTAILVGMMRQSIELGTGKVARLWGYDGLAAGKTGTTSDTKDAWFAGFTPRLMVVVWVGYDDNTAMGLTGAGAALPVWVDVIKGIQKPFQPADFEYPTGVEKRTIQKSDLLRDYPNLPDLPENIELVFGAWAS